MSTEKDVGFQKEVSDGTEPIRRHSVIDDINLEENLDAKYAEQYLSWYECTNADSIPGSPIRLLIFPMSC